MTKEALDLIRQLKAYQAHIAGNINYERFTELSDKLLSVLRQDETKQKILAAIQAIPIPVPSDEEGCFAWLKEQHTDCQPASKDDRHKEWWSAYLTQEQIEDVHSRLNREVSKEEIVKIADLFFDHLKLGHNASLPTDHTDEWKALRGLPMSAIKVGMKLRSTTSATFPIITVTAITEKGFKYSHPPHCWHPLMGSSEEGECYGQDGWSFYELAEPPKQDAP